MEAKMLRCFESCLGRRTPPYRPQTESSSEKLAPGQKKTPMAKFNEGDVVVIEGLVSKPELNGCTARVGTFNVATGRHVVVVEDGTALSMKPSNIQIAARPGRFKAGDVVVIEGLQSKPELNGCTARVRADLVTGRHDVELLKCGTVLSIKPSNARRVTPMEEQAAKRLARAKACTPSRSKLKPHLLLG
eukprot:scaffold120065_cov76-Phaeocystis_antarctica.AAC.1